MHPAKKRDSQPPSSERERSSTDTPTLHLLTTETNRILAGDPAARDRLLKLSTDPALPERLRDLADAISRLADRHLGGAREAVRIRAALARKETELHQAMHDPLTGLPNRVLFEQTLREAMARTQSGALPFAIAFIDLDRVKPVNDTHGHAAGDALLREAAGRLRHSVRSSDTAARIGGDEFAVVLQEITDRPAALAVCDRIIAALGRPYRLAAHDLRIGASIGLAFYPGDGAAPEDLLKNADRALYRAKAAGGNRAECFDNHSHYVPKKDG